MPGMGGGSGGGSPWLTLGEIALFWSAVVVHVLRLLSRPWLPGADPYADAGHAAMAAGMVFMVFPAAPSRLGPPLAVVFGAVAAAFAAAAALRGPGGRRLQYAVVAAENAAMAVMLAAGGKPAPAATVPMALVLAGCAAVHAQRWVRSGSRGHGVSTVGGTRVLVTFPHLSALATTLAMAVMVATA